MRLTRRIVQICALTAALAGCAAASAFASAGIRFESTPTAEAINISSLTFTAEGSSVSCPITLSGSLDEAMQKTAGQLLGEVTSTRVGTCTGGEIRLLTETLPWNLAYASFQGTLPRITGVTLDIKQFAALATVTIFGITSRCLYSGAARGILNGTETTQLRLEEGTPISLVTTLSGICPARGTLRGTGSLSRTLRMTLLEAAGGGIAYTAPTFPNTPATMSVTRNLNIANSSNFSLRVASVQLAGANPGAFSVSSSGIRIRANSMSNLPVTFTPPSAGVFNATVQFLDLNGGVIASINITGTGT
jgi:outer membrane lipoprotein SlyB